MLYTRISRTPHLSLITAILGAVLLLTATSGTAQFPSKWGKWGHQKWCQKKWTWVAGDFHQHTYLTDGSYPFQTVMSENERFGLDWWANSEHGGGWTRDPNGNSWLSYSPNPIISDNPSNGVMWRWRSSTASVRATASW